MTDEQEPQVITKMGYWLGNLQQITQQLGDTKGFVRVVTAWYDSDINWSFWAIHEQMLRAERKVDFLVQSITTTRNHLTTNATPLPTDEAPPAKPYTDKERLKWATKLIQHGVDLIPFSLLGEWEGVRAFLESEDDDED